MMEDENANEDVNIVPEIDGKAILNEETAALTLQKHIRSFLIKRKWVKLISEYKNSPIARPEQLRIKRIHEILETERTFYHTLNLVQLKYIIPMEKSPSIPSSDIFELFNNWDTILTLSERLLERLESQLGKWPCVKFGMGEIFIKMAPFFRNYIIFVSGYSKSLEVLTKLKKVKQIRAWLQAISEDPAFGGKDLTACIITPIQRLPRYVLLLGDLLKATPKDHVEYNDLAKAVDIIKETADSVNSKVKLAEQLTKVYGVQNQLSGDNAPTLVSPHRRYITSGDVQQISEHPSTRHLFLFNDILLICNKRPPSKPRSIINTGISGISGITGTISSVSETFGDLYANFDNQCKYRVHQVVSLCNAVTQSLPNVAPTFQNAFLLSSSELLYFSCESEKDRDNWVTAIRGAIDSLDERFFNSFREEFHSLINHKSRRGKLAIYIPNPEVDENSMRLNWYFSLCELQEDNSLKVFATLQKPEVTLELKNFKLKLLEDRVAKRKYCFELKNDQQDENTVVIWFGAENIDDFDRWISQLHPLCSEMEENDKIITMEEEGETVKRRRSPNPDISEEEIIFVSENLIHVELPK